MSREQPHLTLLAREALEGLGRDRLCYHLAFTFLIKSVTARYEHVVHVVVGKPVPCGVEEFCIARQRMTFTLQDGICSFPNFGHGFRIDPARHDPGRELTFLPDDAANRVGKLRRLDAVHDHAANGDHSVSA